MPSLTLTGLGEVTFAENTVNAAAQRLDEDVTFFTDGALTSARLVVSGLLAEDTVAIHSEGSGAGQISVDGTGQIFHGGVLIGALTAWPAWIWWSPSAPEPRPRRSTR